jgi:ubiquitin-protein ligase
MEKNMIWKSRIEKEKEMLRKMQNDKIKVEFLENDESLLINFEVSTFCVSFLMEFPSGYPFAPPELRLLSSYGLDSLTDLSELESPLEFIICEHWLPVMNLTQIIESLRLYAQISFKPVEKSLILDIFHIKLKVPLMLLLVLVSRVLVINFPHMDWNCLPEFGPYEKFRNAMEVTQNFQMGSWYHTEVVQEIKEPPLFAYFSYVLSYFFLLIDPESIELQTSPGYQSVEQKAFFRISVVLFEFFLLAWPIYIFFERFYKSLVQNVRLAACWLTLSSPTTVIIGHVFFSYCEVNIGLVICAVCMILTEKFAWAAFCLALSFAFSVESAFQVFLICFIIIWLISEKVLEKSQRITQYKKIFLVSEIVLGVLTCFFSFFCPLVIISSPWLMKVDIFTMFNPESIIRVKSPTLLKVLLDWVPLESRVLVQFSLYLLFTLPTLYLIFNQKSIRSRVYLSLFLPSLMVYLLSEAPIQNSILMINLIFSLFNVIECPEMFSLFSVVTSFTLYPQTVLDGSRMAYFISILAFYLLSHYFSKTLNYLSGRSGYRVSLIYILLLSVHLIELFNPSLFKHLHQISSSLILLFFYIWVTKTHFPSVNSKSSHYIPTNIRSSKKKT